MGSYTKVRAVWLWACIACWAATRNEHFQASLSAFHTLTLAASLSLQLLGYYGTTPLLSATLVLSAAKATSAGPILAAWPIVIAVFFSVRTSSVLLEGRQRR